MSFSELSPESRKGDQRIVNLTREFISDIRSIPRADLADAFVGLTGDEVRILKELAELAQQSKF
jgi:hypothetical protein